MFDMKKSIDLVSVIIVVKNDRGIADTLEAIRRTVKVPYETIVVDNSRPEVLADLKANNPWVKWDQFPVSKLRTTPAQRNRGLELASGDLIVFIDANCVPVDEWMDAIVETINSGEDIVCGPVLDLSDNNLVHYAPTLTSGKYIDVCTTVNVGLRREVIERIGNFDCSFSFGQDVDFFWRAADAGFKIYFNPRVAISHDWGQTKEQVRRAYDYGKARAHLFKKHWRNRRHELAHESHVWIYPLYILGLPLTYFVPVYPLLILVPLIKNRSANPVGLVVHHLAYGVGVIAGTAKVWSKDQTSGSAQPL